MPPVLWLESFAHANLAFDFSTFSEMIFKCKHLAICGHNYQFAQAITVFLDAAFGPNPALTEVSDKTPLTSLAGVG